jgi:hypothetical protein
VSEAEIADAVTTLALTMKTIAEPSGAVGVAAALAGRRVGVILSGGNIDPDRIAGIGRGREGPRFSPHAIGGATGRILLVADDPDALFGRAMAAGASPVGGMADEHGWRLGRIVDPFGHEWEIGRPQGPLRGSAGARACGGS